MKTLSVYLDFVTRISPGIMLLPSVFILLGNGYAHAQITPDNSLNTKVTQDGKQFTITDGSQAGSNLFHSFSEFSVPNGGSATFDLSNTTNITNIFSRVTGGNISQIDGKIQIIPAGSNPVSLFLLNPSGIVFGSQASLNISGSFVATTADSIKFADGFKFDATQTTTPPLLTMNVPVGLQLGSNAGTIRTEGTPALNFFYRPAQSFKAQTVALVGSEIDINQSSIANPDGRVELWALRNAELGLNNQAGLQLTSPVTADWGLISLRQASYIDTSGKNGGAINIRGRGLILKEGSSIASTTGASGRGQGITVKTKEFIDLLGVSDPQNYDTPGLFTTVSGSGAKAGNITIETESLRIQNGAWLQSINNSFTFELSSFSTFPVNDTTTGNITVLAKDVEVSGYNPFPNPFTGVANFRPSAITTLVYSGKRNNSGTITIEANQVRLLNGGRISASIIGFPIPGLDSITVGNSGDIFIQARESLEINGATAGGLTGAIISSIQAFAQGEAGNITINTGNLRVTDGGAIASELSGIGNAGNIAIQAQNVEVSKPKLDSFSNTVSGITVAVNKNAVGNGGNISLQAERLRVFQGGQITSSSLGQGSAGSVNLLVNDIDVQGISEPLRDGRILPSSITASAANSFSARSVNINASQLSVRDGAEITVSNLGSGDAGNLNINASQIFLDNGGSLRAEVNGGSRGNIRLNASDFVLLRNGSSIVTNARGTSTGGNINISAESIIAVPTENSDIAANAVLGQGGNIQITTQGLLGLQFREQLTPDSDITASSQFGLSGTVQVNTVGVDPNSGLVELPENVTDPSQQIATGCADTSSSSFIATGRGGIPQNPMQEVRSDRTWSDIRSISAFQNTISVQAPTQPQIPIQATSWHRNAQGQIELIADKSAVNFQPSLTCAAVNQS